MNVNQRASQVWSVLAWAARHRQTITYQQLGQVIGMPPAGLGPVLAPIQTYCLAHKLPPMTVLVVQKNTGLPGPGFTASQAVQVASDQAKVYDHDWLRERHPQEEGFARPEGIRPGNPKR